MPLEIITSDIFSMASLELECLIFKNTYIQVQYAETTK